jgi:HPt (histidine-containing phosphotransfer) domain-containing protein
MRDDGAPEIIADLLNAFKADCLPLLKSMSQAAKANDAATLRKAAHGLKGAAANLGGRAMADLCFNVEQQARNGVVSDVTEMGQIERAFEQLCHELEVEITGDAMQQIASGRE